MANTIQPLDTVTNQPQTLSPRMKALQNLSNQLPVANSVVANGQKAAQDMQIQQAVQKSSPTTNTVQAAQQVGAAAAQTQGQQLISNAATQMKQQDQAGQLALGEQKMAQQAAIGGQQAAATQSQMNNIQRLNAVSEKAKKELYDNQMLFQKDEAGRTLFNSTQLDDYAKLKAGSDEQFKNYQQTSTQLSNRKIQAMEQAQKIINLDLEQKIAIAQQQGNQQAIMDAQKIQADIEARIGREKSRAANKAAAAGAIGTVAGGAAGAILGGPAGAAIGASAGGALGGAINSQIG